MAGQADKVSQNTDVSSLHPRLRFSPLLRSWRGMWFMSLCSPDLSPFLLFLRNHLGDSSRSKPLKTSNLSPGSALHLAVTRFPVSPREQRYLPSLVSFFPRSLLHDLLVIVSAAVPGPFLSSYLFPFILACRFSNFSFSPRVVQIYDHTLCFSVRRLESPVQFTQRCQDL